MKLAHIRGSSIPKVGGKSLDFKATPSAGAQRILIESQGAEETDKRIDLYVDKGMAIYNRLASNPRAIRSEKAFFREFWTAALAEGCTHSPLESIKLSHSVTLGRWNSTNLAFLAFDVGRHLGHEDLGIISLGSFKSAVKSTNFVLDTGNGKCRGVKWLRKQGYCSVSSDLEVLKSAGYLHLGYSLYKNGEYDSANDYFAKAMGANPKCAEAYEYFASTHYDDNNAALKVLESGLENCSNNQDLLLTLAVLHKRMGNKEIEKICDRKLSWLMSRSTFFQYSKMIIGFIGLAALTVLFSFAKQKYESFQQSTKDTIQNIQSVADHKVDSIKSLPLSLGKIGEIVSEVSVSFRDNFNLDFLSRYSAGVIQDMLSARDTTRPLAFVFYPKSDWNGAFYYNQLDDLHKAGYQVVAVESKDPDEFRSLATDLKSRWGTASLVVIGGHGTPYTIQLSENGELYIYERAPFSALRPLLAVGAKIILESCSTAQGDENIAKEISKTTGATVFGPDRPTSIDNFSFSGTGRGVSLAGVSYYNANTKAYQGGRQVSL